MNQPRFLCLPALLLLSLHLCAQQFGGTPASLRWKQIKTDTARIIFPAGEDSLGQRVAALVHDQQKHFSGTLGAGLHRINIVLRNELTYFNGYVALGPFRSEYYITPPQNAFELGAQSTTDMLAIHEYRHVEQYNNFRKGLAKIAYTIFGQNGQALANDAAIPNWFFEGDAVYNETLLSEQGRGRLPFFYNGYKSLFFDNRHYSYMKLRNGSFKSLVPDHYPLGYMLVAYGREKYGDNFWKEVTDKAARFRPLFYPLQGSVKKVTGESYRHFVNDAFAFYQTQWQKEKSDSIAWITKVQRRNVVDYRYPYKSENNGYVVWKESYTKLPHFYRVDERGKEKKLALQSITNDNYFSYNNGKIVYSAFQPNTRWAYREYSVIKVLDVKTNRERRISFKSRYFSPDISHDGKLVAAVSITPQQKSSIDLLSVNGFKIASLSNADNEIYSYPKFSSDDKNIYFFVRRTNGEMSLQQWNIASQQTTVLLPFANRILGFPSVQGDTLVYSSSHEGRDETEAFVISQKKSYQIAHFQTGLYGAVIDDNKAVASAFTSSGYRLGQFNAEWKSIEASADTLVGLYVKKPFGVNANTTLARVPASDQYPVRSYSRVNHPFNFHSLQPDYSNPVFSLTLYGENILSTIQNQIYYNYNQNENYHQVGYNITYGASYVEPFIDISETFNRKVYNAQRHQFNYNELKGIVGLQLPLNLSGGKQYRYLTLTSAYGFDNTQFTGTAKQIASNFANGYLQEQVSYVGQKQQALRQIYPHWAQSVLVQYRQLTSRNTAHQFLARGALYLPALLPSHSLVLEAAYERQTYQSSNNFFNFSLSDNFPYSRGYSSYNFPTMYKAGVNYHLPLLYPDFGVANVVYFRRIRANLYYDYTRIQGHTANGFRQYDLKSTGAELYFDTKWWNQQNVTVGIRYSRLLDYKTTGDQPNHWTLILPSSIFQ